jgi:hypothetical protein
MLIRLVRRARRRYVANELMAEGAVTLCAALFLVILLLVAGTQVLDFHWLVVVPLVALAAGLFRLWRKLPSEYTVARRIDSNLKLADTLSTAFHYLNPPPRAPGSDALRRLQLRSAEETAAGVSMEQAVPFRMPRAMYVVAGLGVLASGLFALRYGFSRQLDLRPPLAQVIQDAMGWTSPVQRAALQKKQQIPEVPSDDMFGMNLPDSDQNTGELDGAADEALESIGIPETDAEKYGGRQVKGEQEAPGAGEEGEEISDEAQASSGAEGAEEGQSDAQSKAGENGKQSAGNKSGEESSLMAKLKEAMQNLLSKMKQQNAGSQQASPSGQQQAKNEKGKSGQKGNSQGMQQGQGQESEGEDGQSGEDAQMAQNPQGKGSGQSPDDSNSKQQGSGIGKQDGDKDTKLAEQLAAMGKISEIIGKRSANVTGEITVEVASGSQQLRTPYAASSAQHGEAAGEVSRDEVPVMYQHFVQRYFEHVRKPAAVAARPDAPRTAPGETLIEPPSGELPPSAAESARRPLPTIRSSGQ